jgi:hypothetical protein
VTSRSALRLVCSQIRLQPREMHRLLVDEIPSFRQAAISTQHQALRSGSSTSPRENCPLPLSPLEHSCQEDPESLLSSSRLSLERCRLWRRRKQSSAVSLRRTAGAEELAMHFSLALVPAKGICPRHRDSIKHRHKRDKARERERILYI